MKSLKIIFWLISLSVLLLNFIGGISAGSALSLAFSRGQSLKLDLTLQQSETAKLGKSLLLAVSIFCQFAILFELFCYVEIYRELYQNDLRIAKNIAPGVIRSRRKRNITTLSGQVASFAIEFTFGFIINAMLAFESHAHMFPIFNCVVSTLISISQFFTSAELRRHYLSK